MVAMSAAVGCGGDRLLVHPSQEASVSWRRVLLRGAVVIVCWCARGRGAGIVTMSAAARYGGDRLLVHSSRRGIGELAMIAAVDAVAIVCRCAGR